jgi:hypothetical protein
VREAVDAEVIVVVEIEAVWEEDEAAGSDVAESSCACSSCFSLAARTRALERVGCLLEADMDVSELELGLGSDMWASVAAGWSSEGRKSI